MLSTYQDELIDKWCARRRAQRRVEAIMLEETRIITPIPESDDAWLNSQPPDQGSGVILVRYHHLLLYDAVRRIISLDDVACFIHESIERYQEAIGRAPEAVWVAEFNKVFYEIYRKCNTLPPPDIPVMGDEQLRAIGMIAYEIPTWTAICVGD